VSPTNSYVGLTTHDPGSAPGEPGKFYPTGTRTYLRISARDTVQAAALLATMKRDQCRRVAIANDREAYGYGLSILMRDQAQGDHVRIVRNTGIDPTAHGYTAYARQVNGEHADCFMFAGIVSNNAIPVVKAVAAASPQARLYGGDGICTTSFTDPLSGGIPATLGRRFKCTVLPLSLGSYAGGRAFVDAYRAMYGVANPDPYAIYGYEAMKLGLDTIAHLGASGNDRRAILGALFATRHRHSVLGTYSFTKTGDTTLRTYGVYRVAHGAPTFLTDAFAH
jgi:branched-chain amino acid transport system substrate-binding protein